jgi:hypothetical protein
MYIQTHVYLDYHSIHLISLFKPFLKTSRQLLPTMLAYILGILGTMGTYLV